MTPAERDLTELAETARLDRLTTARIAMIRVGIVATMFLLAVISWTERWCH